MLALQKIAKHLTLQSYIIGYLIKRPSCGFQLCVLIGAVHWACTYGQQGEAALGLEGWGRAAFLTMSTCSLSVAVIGHKVNLAARLMVHYPRLVACDEATYTASRLPGYFFRELPETKLKGVTNPGHIYQYVGITEKW